MTGNQVDMIIEQLIQTNTTLAKTQIELAEVKTELKNIPDKTEKIARVTALGEIAEQVKLCQSSKRNSVDPKPITRVLSVDEKTQRWLTYTLLGIAGVLAGVNLETVLKLIGIGG